jgi:nucleotidyltransferase-like protein
MDDRLLAAPVVPAFAAEVRAVARVIGFYAGGSIGSGDYRPGISDLDLVAVIEAPLTRDRRARLRELHRASGVAKLHCAYVPAGDATDIGVKHVNWAQEHMFRRTLSGIARAELHQFGVTVYGPPPETFIPPVGPAALAEAARVELRGYWTGAVRRRKVWDTDLHVDLGLTTVSRAGVTIAEGRLITKREAIDRLPAMGVPPELADQIRRRRAGERIELSEAGIADRAVLVRRLMRENMNHLLTRQ